MAAELPLPPVGTEGLKPGSPEDVFVFPTTVGQKRFWSLDALQPGSSAANIPCAARLAGRLNRAAVQQSLDEIMRRHEGLRSRFEVDGDELMQVVYPPRPVEIAWIDCTAAPPPEWPAKTAAVQLEQGSRPFALSTGPFLRGAVAIFSPTEHVIMLTMHHIATDGWSNGILIREFAENYTRIVQGQTPPFDDLPLQYADYAVWQKDWLTQPEGEAQKEYWTGHLGESIPVLNLPTDHPRSRKATTNGTINSLLLPAKLSEGMRQLCQRENATPFMGYLAAYVMLLNRYSGRTEFVIGTPAACRNQTELEGLIGLFANVILFRPRVEPTMTFRQLLHHVRDTAIASFARQEYPFEMVGENLRTEDSRRGVPWLQAYFLYQKAFMQPQKMPELDLTPLRSISPGAMFEWLLGLIERNEGVRLQLEYNTDLFDSTTIDRALRQLQKIIDTAIATPDFAIAELELDEPEKNAGLAGPALQTPLPASLLNEVVAGVQGDESIVLFQSGGNSLTLADLRAYAIRISELVAQFSADRQPWRIAIAGHDPCFLLASAIAICQSGHTAVLASAPADAQLGGTLEKPVWERTSGAKSEPAPASPGFILHNDFTAGPDGIVAVESTRLALQARAVGAASKIHHGDVVLSTSSLQSVAAWEEILGAWLNHATVCHDSDEAIGRENTPVSIAFLTSSTLQEALRKKPRGALGGLNTLRAIVVDRDPIFPAALEMLRTSCQCVLQRLQVRETGATMAVQELLGDGSSPGASPLTIIAGWKLDIVDRRNFPAPAGVPGRLQIRGSLLGADTAVLTGDWVRIRQNGRLEWISFDEDLARTANYTLELSELAAVACRQRAIWAAVAIASEAGGVTLHLVPAPGTRAAPADIDSFLAENLPAYLLPAATVWHDRLPITDGGHLDYANLRAPHWLTNAAARAAQEPAGSSPADDIEKKLSELYAKLLRLKTVDVRRSFFDLGGHSLLAVKLFTRIEKEFHRRLPLATLLGSPSVRALAVKLRAALGGENQWSCLVPVQSGGDGPRFFCVHGAGGNVLLYRDLARRMSPEVRFYGLQAQGLDGQSESLTRVEAMAELYLQEILAEQPTGPYFVGGYCMGGNIAYEIARLLVRKGHRVGFVAMLDSYNLKKSLYRGTGTDRLRIWMQKGGFHLDTLVHLSMAERKAYFSEKMRMAREMIKGKWQAVRGGRKARTARESAGDGAVAFVQNANHIALDAHDPQSLEGKVVVFRPRKNYFTFPDPSQGWGDLVSTPVESVEVTANPHAMLIEPFVQKLATELKRRIL